MTRKEPRSKIQKMEHLFKEHYSFLCLVSFSIIRDRNAAKDVVHDFFISYWQKQETITITNSFKAYAVRAVKNLSLRQIERTKKERLLIQNLNPPKYEEQKDFEKARGNNDVQELLNQLPESRRKIFISVVVHGLSYSETAEINNISVNTVKTQMKRAYAFLRSQASDEVLRNET